MSFTTIHSDGFADTNGTQLIFHGPDNALGGSGAPAWQEVVGSPSWTIQSNQAGNPDASFGPTHIAILNTTAVTDCRVTGVAGTNGNGVAVVARYESGTGKWYQFGGGVGGSQILYWDGAAFNVLHAGGVGFSPGDSVALVCAGNALKGYVNGVLTVDTTDPGSNIASGKPGMYSAGQSNGFDSIVFETGTASAATPTNLGLTTAPVGNQSGVSYTTQPVIAVRDAGLATVTTDTSTVTASITVLTGSVTLGGTTSKAAVAGVATFTNLAPTGTGSYTMTFSDGALAVATTGTLYVGATQLAITSAPTTAFSKHASTIVVTAKDGGGTAVGNYTGTVAVTLNKLSGGSSVATLTGGTSSAAAVTGVATLTPIATTTDNGLVATSYTYTAAASGLTSATTATITPTVSESISVTIT